MQARRCPVGLVGDMPGPAEGFRNKRIRKVRGAHGERLIRNSPSETVAPRNRRLVIDRHPNQFG